MEDRPLSIRARKKVKAQVEKSERERLMRLFQRRMDLARSGAIFFRDGKLREALQNYFGYLDVLEKTKGIAKGRLDPTHFDHKRDIAELLLLSGVFWDLAKLHDRAKQKDLDKLNYYLERFVMFSKGMPYQHISAELVRKFLLNGLPKNRKEFKETHIKLGGGKCFIATSVEDYCEPATLDILRAFRDTYFMKRHWGRVLVRVYYRVGPPLALLVLRTPESFQRKLARTFDQVAAKCKD